MKIPFDIEKAKAGAKVVTRGGLPVTILSYAGKFSDARNLVAVIHGEYTDTISRYSEFGLIRATGNNQDDLFLEVEPEYKPFDLSNAPVGKIVTRKGTKDKSLIVFSDNTLVGIGRLTYSYEYLLEYFTFEDGSPCGVLVS